MLFDVWVCLRTLKEGRVRLDARAGSFEFYQYGANKARE